MSSPSSERVGKLEQTPPAGHTTRWQSIKASPTFYSLFSTETRTTGKWETLQRKTFVFHALVNFESLLSGECKENVQNDIFRKNICTFLEKGIKTETTISSGFRMVLPKLTKKS